MRGAWSFGLVALAAFAAPLEVRVVDERTGKPLAGALVRVGERTERTVDGGVLAFEPVQVGDRLFAEAPEYLQYVAMITSASLERPLKVAMTPNRDFRKDVAVHGTALEADGGVLAGRVTAKCGVTSGEAVVAPDGGFDFPKLASGPCQFRFIGGFSGVGALQFTAIDAQHRALRFGPPSEPVAVTVTLKNAPPELEVFLVSGDLWRGPRTCLFDERLLGHPVAWEDPGVRCVRGDELTDVFVCPSAPAGRYTVVAQQTLERSETRWQMNQWMQRAGVYGKAAVVVVPPFKRPPHETGDLPCPWP